MRRIRTALGVMLATFAAALLVAQLLSLVANGAYRPVSLAVIWAAFDAEGLAGLRAAIESGLPSPVRGPLAWLLDLPAWLVAGLLALPLLLAGRRARRGFD